MMKILIAIIVVVALAGGYFILGSGQSITQETVTDTATTATKVAAQKGKEAVADSGSQAIEAGKNALEEGKEDVMDKSKKVIGETIDKATDQAKENVGTAVKDVGQKVLGDQGATVGTFEDYAPEKIAANGGAIIDFAADWCPTCRAFEANVLENLQDIPADLTILKADFDTELELRKQYGVTQQHTFVQVDAQGNEIAKWVGSPTLETFLAKVQ